MSNSPHRSLFLLVRVKPKGKMRIVVPVPLYILDATLAAISDLLWLPDLLFPVWRKSLAGKIKLPPGLTPGKAWNLIVELIDEVRKYGRWRMVEVENEDARIYIDFY